MKGSVDDDKEIIKFWHTFQLHNCVKTWERLEYFFQNFLSKANIEWNFKFIFNCTNILHVHITIKLYLLSIIFHLFFCYIRASGKNVFSPSWNVFCGMKQFTRFKLNFFSALISERPKICVLSFFMSSQVDFSLESFVAELAGERLETYG